MKDKAFKNVFESRDTEVPSSTQKKVLKQTEMIILRVHILKRKVHLYAGFEISLEEAICCVQTLISSSEPVITYDFIKGLPLQETLGSFHICST